MYNVTEIAVEKKHTNSQTQQNAINKMQFN